MIGHAEGAAGAPTGTETHAELRPLGINIEAWPFVIAAVLASLVLAAASPGVPLPLTTRTSTEPGSAAVALS